LRIGQTVDTQLTKQKCKVESFLGGGGQGEVYKATVTGGAVAVKWYFPGYLSIDPGLKGRLERAVQKGAPTPKFLWPKDLVSAEGTGSFGYVMPLREPTFKGFDDLKARRVNPTFRVLVTAGFELAHSYEQLHADGMCYRDVNDKNVFFEPGTGDVRICDNDNVDVNGQPGGIAGMLDFMAPEIVRGEAAPTSKTDLHSLATLLFQLLHNHHPLKGRRMMNIRR
jgi:DNA-binding helix-hairpin-helix protein with protein kinase domain